MGNEGARGGSLSGQIVAGYELVHLLAVGGMGDVYLARNLKLGVLRAIKVIRASQRRDPIATERFRREAQMLARLEHKSIVRIFELGGLENGWPYFVMEYVDGPSLDEVIDKHGPLPIADALAVLERIANAVVYAHGMDIIHRDLKPANVLVRSGVLRQVKIIDFGLARTLEGEHIIRLTDKGQMLGSPQYMAPEQAEGALEITRAADIYAFAGIAYKLLSGRSVFQATKPIALMHAHLTLIPPRISERRPDVAPLLDDLLFACLTKEPHLRPRADEVATHVARLARQHGDDEPDDAASDELDDTAAELSNTGSDALGDTLSAVKRPT